MFGWFRRLLGSLETPDGEVGQFVRIHLHAASSSADHWHVVELDYLLNDLQSRLGIEGEVRPPIFKEDAVSILIFGDDAETMYRLIRPVLRHKSMTRNARIELIGPEKQVRSIHFAN
ncbi:hypothetical protein [Novosphingobium taihuense]|uniref:Uncharacterized protein n=1 Tax=Novosphingobium taihuense TaxID=260085 RepID=A0A7W7AED7_9SPHN|nr:hypothetical protein [Novosphingobium taihuense]MBB4614745.1 hypothetical protein [Novosphingobium taihuense]TWH86013.1 hypothetical protein IQ25_01460 [Novosphingobium taihuense]